jgi:hypothetical protein
MRASALGPELVLGCCRIAVIATRPDRRDERTTRNVMRILLRVCVYHHAPRDHGVNAFNLLQTHASCCVKPRSYRAD